MVTQTNTQVSLLRWRHTECKMWTRDAPVYSRVSAFRCLPLGYPPTHLVSMIWRYPDIPQGDTYAELSTSLCPSLRLCLHHRTQQTGHDPLLAVCQRHRRFTLVSASVQGRHDVDEEAVCVRLSLAVVAERVPSPTYYQPKNGQK